MLSAFTCISYFLPSFPRPPTLVAQMLAGFCVPVYLWRARSKRTRKIFEVCGWSISSYLCSPVHTMSCADQVRGSSACVARWQVCEGVHFLNNACVHTRVLIRLVCTVRLSAASHLYILMITSPPDILMPICGTEAVPETAYSRLLLRGGC